MEQELREINERDFLEFYHQAEYANYLQSVEMAHLRSARGYAVEYIGLFLDRELVIVALLASKNTKIGRIFSIDGGPIGNLSHIKVFLTKLHPYLKTKKAIFCQITPHLVIQRLSSFGDILENCNQKQIGIIEKYCLHSHINLSARFSWQYIKHLEGLSMKNITMSLNQTSRQIYKKALGCQLKINEEKNLENLSKLLDQTADRKNFTRKGLRYYQELKEAFGNKVKFLSVYYKGEIIAGGVFILDRDELIHLFGGSKKELSNSTGAPTFLQIHAMQFTLKRGYKKYNFYGIFGKFDGSDHLLNFKKAFRGEVERYADPYDLVINELKYRLWRILNR